jgi:phosphoribosylformimino-5-aminoimidazole carboxamide ribotide isomerase
VVDYARLDEMVAAVGGKQRLVLDLSCRKRRRAPTAAATAAVGSATGDGGDGVGEFEYVVVTDRWQRWTDAVVDAESLARLASYCDEFLVHGVDVEGLRAGIEDGLVALLGEHSPIPVTYAGGVRGMEDLERVKASW